MLRRVFLFPVLFFFLSIVTSAQPLAEKDHLRVFLDCSFCDFNVMRINVPYIDYLRDPAKADVHVLGTRVTSGSGGYNYTFEFIGHESFEGMIIEKQADEGPNTALSSRQEMLSRLVEKGLTPFWSQTAMIDNMEIHVKRSLNEDEAEVVAGEDPWNNWVFSFEAGGSFDFETVSKNSRLWGRIRVNRISEIWRVRNTFYTRTQNKEFDSDGEIIYSTVESSFLSSSVVRSLNDHWSVGAFLSFARSTYSNLDLSTRFAPALEYSIFPYREVNQREVTVAYRMSHLYRDYTEETIYQKLEENLYNQSVVLQARFKQPWGTLYAQLEGSHFLHDIKQNRIEFEGYLSVRVSKGLSIRVGSDFQLINDQRSLPARDISLEELLLAQRQSATNFRFGSEFGLSYTFGSIYNNIVNTRL